jgi:RHS repeat-associated protein
LINQTTITDATQNYDVDHQTAGNYTYDQIGNLTSDVKERIDGITWMNNGKLKSINAKSTAPASPNNDLNFEYDASGNRVSKQVLTNAGADLNTTYYIRDAQGNVMATYLIDASSFKLVEQHIFGSSRLGMDVTGYNYSITPPPVSNIFTKIVNKRQYEISNHLGNVLSVFTDKRIPRDISPANGTIDFYLTNETNATDYYPFGQTIPARNLVQAGVGNYRYGFNGKENDNEVKGNGNQQDYGMRIYDPRLGRFLSVDPKVREFSYWSPYLFAANSPLKYIDIDGEGPGDVIVTKHKMHKENGKTIIEVEASVNVKIKILNLSSQPNIDVDKIGYLSTKGLGDEFGGESNYQITQSLMYDGGIHKKPTEVTVNAKINYNVSYEIINSLDDKSISSSDNVVILVDKIKNQGKLDAGGLTNVIGGNVALVEVSGPPDPNNVNQFYNGIAATVKHEFGHQVGLDEAYIFDQISGKMIQNTIGNTMGSGQSHNSTINNSQRGQIANHALNSEGSKCKWGNKAGGGYNSSEAKQFLQKQGEAYKGKK